MKRIAAPMVGGLVTSAFLTLEIIPVIYTYWRNEQLLWRKLHDADERRLRFLHRLAFAIKAAAFIGGAALVSRIYLAAPPTAVAVLPAIMGAVGLAAFIAYIVQRHRARSVLQATSVSSGAQLDTHKGEDDEKPTK
jgi:Cu(I)/Ag(I) efflux system membrane protein CusA/SilA